MKLWEVLEVIDSGSMIVLIIGHMVYHQDSRENFQSTLDDEDLYSTVTNICPLDERLVLITTKQ